VNLCADPFQKRLALGPGDYTISVGLDGPPIAATGITLALPPVPIAEQDQADTGSP
jgi:hypothetical protein